MNYLSLQIALLIAAAICIGGWAFMKLIEPANMINLLQVFSMC